ncbi:MAG TPA: hypothetical protein VEJ84_13355 [Acidimicrobiales bacterium]|nr:hypothetical protein [Acidimicrobiales bacterium]
MKTPLHCERERAILERPQRNSVLATRACTGGATVPLEQPADAHRAPEAG